uniref:ATP synthase subunit d n=1 Tax=Euglena gracilis TaxID=3039 RepID=UPI0012B67DC9|nr:Chain H, ATP synthase subunit d [Euglena gracilis]6TDU_h Chain h, ATP synthase subunit d [Euglena gracilis]6TDV_H Chain H, subunit d [Euglena gracilis]6TDV_h Chain h, subunit d [Euglena gracilis]6TDW_H Chain H, subunit d [Euglena gracilis]6TDY_h Chain h, ATP synthase subunit d [Euglena gracilis]6TDZ_h Chain h, subunit d [Euglena gracilis]
MMRRACRIIRPSHVRGVSGVAPTIYLRSKAALPATSTTDVRPQLYALQRFAKAQLKTATEAERAAIEADIARYQEYLDSDLEKLKQDVAEDTAKKQKLIPLLDRYPDVPIEKIPEHANVLLKKIDACLEILSKDIGEVTDAEAHEMYFETSKFQILHIYTGCVASFPEGDVPPGAVECLPGQVIRTKVNGEDVMLEIDEVDPGYQVCWFKPDVPLPENAEILWSYPYEPTAALPTGTTWEEGQANVLIPAEPTPEAAVWPPTPVTNVYAPMAEKLALKSNPELKVLFKEALLQPAKLLPLDVDYQCSHDREVVEAKRDRYLTALVEAEQAPPLPFTPDVLQLQLEHNVLKGELIDRLRALEYTIVTEQLQARLHERRLRGDVIDEWEELDYHPLVRDDTYLAIDFGDPTFGRYIWKLFPHTDGDEECMFKDTRLDVLPPQVNPLNAILAQHTAQTPVHRSLEKRLWTEVRATAVSE